MKKYLGSVLFSFLFLFLSLTPSVLQSEIIHEAEIIGITLTERHDVFNLYSDDPSLNLVLDCASFFYNFEIQSEHYDRIFYLTAHECWSIFDIVTNLSQQRSCLFFKTNSFSFKEC